MKTQFIKNYSKNYLILEDFTDYNYSDDFRIEMLSNNNIPGTLDFSYDIVDNKPIFKYDITSRQSFASLFSTADISYKAFTSVVLSLIDIINFLEEYLIDINSLLISSEYIYLDPEKYTTYFIICPAINNDFYIKLSDFFNDLLKKIDHEDDKLVLLAYRLSSSTQKDSFNISMLKNIILSSGYDTSYTKDNTTDIPNKLNTASIQDTIHENTNSVNLTIKTDLDENILNKTKSLKNSSALIHNKSTIFGNLYTISTSFYIKSCFLGGIFLVIIGFGVYCLYTKLLSFDISLFILFLGIIFLIGSIKYLYELYPSTKIPFINSRLPISVANKNTFEDSNYSENDFTDNIYTSKIPDNIINSSCSNTEIFNNNSNNNDDYEFGNTIILSTRNKHNNHRLVYTGTDYVDNVPINSYPFIIGKLKKSVNMIINNPLISRIHACIYMDEEECFIEDMNSSNGTYVNDILLKPHEKFPLKEGDKITFSHLIYIFE